MSSLCECMLCLYMHAFLSLENGIRRTPMLQGGPRRGSSLQLQERCCTAQAAPFLAAPFLVPDAHEEKCGKVLLHMQKGAARAAPFTLRGDLCPSPADWPHGSLASRESHGGVQIMTAAGPAGQRRRKLSVSLCLSVSLSLCLSVSLYLSLALPLLLCLCLSVSCSLALSLCPAVRPMTLYYGASLI